MDEWKTEGRLRGRLVSASALPSALDTTTPCRTNRSESSPGTWRSAVMADLSWGGTRYTSMGS